MALLKEEQSKRMGNLFCENITTKDWKVCEKSHSIFSLQIAADFIK